MLTECKVTNSESLSLRCQEKITTQNKWWKERKKLDWELSSGLYSDFFFFCSPFFITQCILPFSAIHSKANNRDLNRRPIRWISHIGRFSILSLMLAAINCYRRQLDSLFTTKKACGNVTHIHTNTMSFYSKRPSIFHQATQKSDEHANNN